MNTVISLTTMPERGRRIEPVLDSLLAQGLPVFLWLPTVVTRTGSKWDKVPEFFEKVRAWYGHDDNQLAEIEYWERRVDENGVEYWIPVPEIPEFEDYDLGLSQPTHFETFRVYVPWIPFEDRAAGLPAEFQMYGTSDLLGMTGPGPVGNDEFVPLNLSSYFEGSGGVHGLASITGPMTAETNGFLPTNKPLPYTIHFENDPIATTQPGEIRIVTKLDGDLDGHSFRLGDMKVGQINIHIPNNQSIFQGEFDFTEALGFILRISAGIDINGNEATWLIQAIDSDTGEVVQDPSKGLLIPNNTQGHGAGFVSYTVEPVDDIKTGTVIDAHARVLFNNTPPEDTPGLSQFVDGSAPTTALIISTISQTGEQYLVEWNVQDDQFGSGFRHVTLYAATDGGDFLIWQHQLTEASGSLVYEGEAGHMY